MTTNPNSPISPTIESKNHGDLVETYTNEYGLTKREYLACKMQAAFISHFGAEYAKDDWHAAEGVKAADALINELNKTTS